HRHLCTNQLRVERFRREATSIGALENEHALAVLDFGQTPDNRLFMAMELLEGETLARVLEREGRLAPARLAAVLVQTAQALSEAHELGYVHRDLRPRNLFLMRRRGTGEFVKLLDFGLAKLVGEDGEAPQSQLAMSFGDARYLAPEQARGLPIDRRADIYAL